MDLEADIFKPYIKPNTTPLYIDKQSNHPPTIIKNIPASINRRLSSIACNKEKFDKAAPLYKEALAKSGYKYQLEFNSEAANNRQNTKNRRRHITWLIPHSAKMLKLMWEKNSYP